MSDWKPKAGDVVCLTQEGRFGGRSVAKRTIRSVNTRHVRLEMEDAVQRSGSAAMSATARF